MTPTNSAVRRLSSSRHLNQKRRRKANSQRNLGQKRIGKSIARAALPFYCKDCTTRHCPLKCTCRHSRGSYHTCPSSPHPATLYCNHRLYVSCLSFECAWSDWMVVSREANQSAMGGFKLNKRVVNLSVPLVNLSVALSSTLIDRMRLCCSLCIVFLILG